MSNSSSFVLERVNELESFTDKTFCQLLEQVDNDIGDMPSASEKYISLLREILSTAIMQRVSEYSSADCNNVKTKKTRNSIIDYIGKLHTLQSELQGEQPQLIAALELYVQFKIALWLYGSLMNQLLSYTTDFAVDIRYWKAVESSHFQLALNFAAELPTKLFEAATELAVLVKQHVPNLARPKRISFTMLKWRDLISVIAPIGSLPRRYLYGFSASRRSLKYVVLRSLRAQNRLRTMRLVQMRNYFAGSLGILALQYGSPEYLFGKGATVHRSVSDASFNGTSDAAIADADFQLASTPELHLAGQTESTNLPLLKRRLDLLVGHVGSITERIEKSVDVMDARRREASRGFATRALLWWQHRDPEQGLASSEDEGESNTVSISALLDVTSVAGALARSSGDANMYSDLTRLLHVDQKVDALVGRVRELYGKPSRAVRYWIPGSCGVILLYIAGKYSAANFAYLKELFSNGYDTIKEFGTNWVWQPMVGIYKTVRHEDNLTVLGASSLEADFQSLEHMVVEFAKEHGSLTEAQITEITEKTRAGDLGVVLRAYEDEIKSPFKNAVRGELVRLLLIQVQKAKVDLELSLSAMDKLLKSNELNFAFLAIVPTIMISVGTYRSLRQMVMRRRGQTQKQVCRAISQTLDHVDRILTKYITIGEMHPQSYGQLLCEVAYLRSLTRQITSLNSSSVLEDLRLLETTKRNSAQKLRVVDRLFREIHSSNANEVL